MKRLNESPDYIIIDGKKITAKDHKQKHRPFIVFRSGDVWVGSIGQTHEELIDNEEGAADIVSALMGRVWMTAGVISLWHNPMLMFGEDYVHYIDLLKTELNRYNIDLMKMKFDLYNTWEPMPKKFVDPKMMVKYYDDSSHTYSTPTDDYVSYMERLKKYAMLANETPSTAKTTQSELDKRMRTSGSPKTSWDSPNNIRYRNAQRTSESFYPTLRGR